MHVLQAMAELNYGRPIVRLPLFPQILAKYSKLLDLEGFQIEKSILLTIFPVAKWGTMLPKTIEEEGEIIEELRACAQHQKCPKLWEKAVKIPISSSNDIHVISSLLITEEYCSINLQLIW
jgi:hypothetical protein